MLDHLYKQGYLKGYKAFIPSTSAINYTRIVLLANSSGHAVSSATGGKITLPNGASVEFQANSFVMPDGNAYSGNVDINIRHLSPDEANFGLSLPGGDLAATDLSGNSVVLYSYGMLAVELTGSGGQTLQLAEGKTANLVFPVAAMQQSHAPATIPLWYFDEKDLLWKEEGQAIKTGNNYVGTVSHFTWWNCDFPGPLAQIHGRVVDCEGTPFGNIIVTANGNMTISTDQMGYYAGVVPSSLAFTFQVLSAKNNGLSSQMESVAALSTGQIFQVPDLIINCPARISGEITGCNNEAIDGLVLLLSQGQIIHYETCHTGSFKVAVPPSSTFILNTISGSAVQSNSVSSGLIGTLVNAGTIQHCDTGGTVTPENSFFITGDGFTNELIYFDSINHSTLNHYWGDNTVARHIGTSNYGNLTLDLFLSFPDSIKGTFSYPPNESYIEVKFPQLQKHYYWRQQITIVVSEYGLVGEPVKGTFSGILHSIDGLQSVIISNGKFSFVRGPDEP